MKSSQNSTMERLPQLDGLRAIAVFLVMLSHNPPFPIDGWPIEFGVASVYLFFVLSGYLITGILLEVRAWIDSGECSVGNAFGIFYARRALRLTPAYYFALLTLWILNVPKFRDFAGYYSTYLANYMLYHEYSPGLRYVCHFWTLAIEEQFYLVWPLLVLLASRRVMISLIVAGICLSPAFRLFHYMQVPYGFMVNCPPWCNLDGLGLGALLAITKSLSAPYQRVRDRCILVGLVVGGLLMSGELATGYFDRGYKLRYAFASMGYTLVSCWVVARAVKGFGGRVGEILASRSLTYIGTISYGIYLYHELVPAWLDGLASVGIGWGLPEASTLSRTVLVMGLSIGSAALSWHVFEEPIGRLKSYLKYKKSPRPVVIPPLSPLPSLPSGLLRSGREEYPLPRRQTGAYSHE